MKFKLEFDVDNDAFGNDEQDRNDEIIRIMCELEKRILTDCIDLEFGHHIYDVNGNRIGTVEIS